VVPTLTFTCCHLPAKVRITKIVAQSYPKHRKEIAEYYRCNYEYLFIFPIQSCWIMTSTTYAICFLSLNCSNQLLHTLANTCTVSLYSFFGMGVGGISQHLKCIWQHFGTPCLFLLPAYTTYEDGRECSET
jgi:hypothetical protein